MLKGFKQVLGVGKAEDFYARALGELSQQNPAGAIESFSTAARKAQGENRPDLGARAEASAHLYRFVVHGGLDHLAGMARHLPVAGWIERPGEPSDRVPAGPMIAEIEGRLAAAAADGRNADAAQEAHWKAAEAFDRCGDHRLVTYAYHHDGDRHVDVARNRQLYHTGRRYALAGERLIDSDPDAAVLAMGRAVAAFAACEDVEAQQACAEGLRRMQTRRTCWVCHREFPGEGRYYGRAEAQLTPFIAQHVTAQGEDASCVDIGAGKVVVCTVCRTLIDGRAERLVEAMAARILSSIDARVAAVVQSMSRQ